MAGTLGRQSRWRTPLFRESGRSWRSATNIPANWPSAWRGGCIRPASAVRRRLAPEDLHPAEGKGPREGARVLRRLSQGRLHDGNRELARTRRRPHRIHHAPAPQRGLNATLSRLAARGCASARNQLLTSIFMGIHASNPTIYIGPPQNIDIFDINDFARIPKLLETKTSPSSEHIR